MIYELSEEGRQITYSDWRKMGGCGVPNGTRATCNLGPMAHWNINELTLGQIEDACPYTGRCFARFAVEHLNHHKIAVPYVRK